MSKTQDALEALDMLAYTMEGEGIYYETEESYIETIRQALEQAGQFEAAVRDLTHELQQAEKYIRAVALLIEDRNGAHSEIAEELAMPLKVKALGMAKKRAAILKEMWFTAVCNSSF